MEERGWQMQSLLSPRRGQTRWKKACLGPRAAAGWPGACAAGRASEAGGWLSTHRNGSACTQLSTWKGLKSQRISCYFVLKVHSAALLFIKDKKKAKCSERGTQKTFRTSALHNQMSLGRMLSLFWAEPLHSYDASEGSHFTAKKDRKDIGTWQPEHPPNLWR